MSRYVDIEPYEKCVLQRYYRNSMGECVETIPLCGLPTADVQEVRHGRWIDITKCRGNSVFKCSECGDLQLEESYYCPNCGASMDEVEE